MFPILKSDFNKILFFASFLLAIAIMDLPRDWYVVLPGIVLVPCIGIVFTAHSDWKDQFRVIWVITGITIPAVYSIGQDQGLSKSVWIFIDLATICVFLLAVYKNHTFVKNKDNRDSDY